MKHTDIKMMMAELAPVIREFTVAALAPVQAQIEALTKRLDEMPIPSNGKDGSDGKDADLAEVQRMIDQAVSTITPIDNDNLRNLLAFDTGSIVTQVEEKVVTGLQEFIERSISDARTKLLSELPTTGEISAEVESNIHPLVQKDLEELENRLLAKIPAKEFLVGEVAASLPDPRDAIQAMEKEILLQVDDRVQVAIAALPVPQNGKDGADGRDGIDGKDGADGRDGIDGKDGRDGVDGQNGIDGKDGADGRDGVDGTNGKDGEKGLDGKDGIGLAGAIIDRSGELVITATDGRAFRLGPVVGKDGAPGRDGVGFEDMTEELDADGRTIIRRYMHGQEVVKEIRHKFSFAVIDKGVYKEGQPYSRGDGVTYSRHFWIAQDDTDTVPIPGNPAWRIAVKSGRDGKDGKDATSIPEVKKLVRTE